MTGCYLHRSIVVPASNYSDARTTSPKSAARLRKTSDDRRLEVIVTGGNSGVGEATAAALAAAAMSGDVTIAHLDLADLTSVRKFADSVDGVDVLINNAGVSGLPLTRAADGFEAHMGTNYLGHFALTCLLGDRIRDRVVSVVSSAYSSSHLHIDDLIGTTAGTRSGRRTGNPNWPSCCSTSSWSAVACDWPV
jgi:nucleoside-diphosphate-sugar epimerase